MLTHEVVDVVRMTPLWPDRSWGLMISPGRRCSLAAWARANSQSVNDLILQHGAILFRNFDIADTHDLETFADQVTGSDFVSYREAATPRKHVAGNTFTSTEYPKAFRIYVHNENSHVTSWPMYLFFHCMTAPAEGGATPLADCRGVYRRLPKHVLDRFSEQGFLYRRNFFAHSAISWQAAFNVDGRRDLEAYCLANHMQPEWTEDGLTIRYRRWATARHPKTGDLLWFNHGLFFNPHSLEPVLKEALEGLDDDEYVSTTYYGDGSTIEDETLQVLDDAYDVETAFFAWHSGDVLMVDNMRIAHGRQPYSGDRKVVVTMKAAVSFLDIADCRKFAPSSGL